MTKEPRLVYIVFYMDYGGEYKIDTIFDTEEKAKMYIKGMKKIDPDTPFLVEIYGVR